MTHTFPTCNDAMLWQNHDLKDNRKVTLYRRKTFTDQTPSNLPARFPSQYIQPWHFVSAWRIAVGRCLLSSLSRTCLRSASAAVHSVVLCSPLRAHVLHIQPVAQRGCCLAVLQCGLDLLDGCLAGRQLSLGHLLLGLILPHPALMLLQYLHHGT